VSGPAPQRREVWKAELEDELARIVERLRQIGAHKAILFGPLAGRTVRLSSDIDLIVVIDAPQDEDFLARQQRIYDALAPQVPLDLLVYTPEEFEHQKRYSATVRSALKHGRSLL